MKKYIRLNDDIVIADQQILAIIKNRDKVATDTGLVEQINMFIYIENSQVPIVISTTNKEEANEFEKKLLGE